MVGKQHVLKRPILLKNSEKLPRFRFWLYTNKIDLLKLLKKNFGAVRETADIQPQNSFSTELHKVGCPITLLNALV